jgi:cell wall-associated NlpC family hydrolase
MHCNRFSRFYLLFFFLLFLTSCSVTGRKKSTLVQEQLRQNAVSNAKQELGKPYKNGGIGPLAYDCSGLVFTAYKKAGVVLPRTSHDQSKVGKSRPVRKASPGDLVFFSDKGKVNHVGIVVKNTHDGLMMIHSSTSRGVVLESVHDSSYWAKRLKKVRSVIF